jgi:hypothetical protein
MSLLQLGPIIFGGAPGIITYLRNRNLLAQNKNCARYSICSILESPVTWDIIMQMYSCHDRTTSTWNKRLGVWSRKYGIYFCNYNRNTFSDAHLTLDDVPNTLAQAVKKDVYKFFNVFGIAPPSGRSTYGRLYKISGTQILLYQHTRYKICSSLEFGDLITIGGTIVHYNNSSLDFNSSIISCEND